MISKPIRMLFGSPVKRARLLAVLVLASLAWSTTVEFTHHHGAKSRSAELLANDSQRVEANSNQFSPSDPNGASSHSKTGAECLICQLHQNLSATVIGHAPGVGPAETRGLSTPPCAVVQLSDFTIPGHGRAPPSIL